jgi:FAD/FMN-containing dehydrogenase
LERFFDEGISIDMVRRKIVKQALQQGFTSRSRWLLQILGLIQNLKKMVDPHNVMNPGKLQPADGGLQGNG